MKSSQVIENELLKFRKNELIFASRLYRECFAEKIKEVTFYKTLERFCETGKLCKLAKGTYYLPKKSKYGIVPPSEKEIVKTFIENKKGTVIGYQLYNSLNLTTQVSKTVSVLSSNLEGQTKVIRNVEIKQVPLDYSKETETMIHALDVLQNFHRIQDINYPAFLSFCREFSNSYRNEVFENVASKIKYQKSTISFLHEILNYYGVSNTLGRYLSGLSNYNHPKMEKIYEAAGISRRI